MDEFVDEALRADQLAATAEMRAVVFRVHAREAAMSASNAGSPEARSLFTALAQQRQETAELLSAQASCLRRTARLAAEAGEQVALAEAWASKHRI